MEPPEDFAVPAVSSAAHLVHEGCTPAFAALSSACSAACQLSVLNNGTVKTYRPYSCDGLSLMRGLPKSRLLGNTTVRPCIEV